jgi:hypothetical protein
MHTRNKVIYLLLILNLTFFVIFFIALALLHRHVPFITIGLPAMMINWLVMALSLASMAFVVYQLYRLKAYRV